MWAIRMVISISRNRLSVWNQPNNVLASQSPSPVLVMAPAKPMKNAIWMHMSQLVLAWMSWKVIRPIFGMIMIPM